MTSEETARFVQNILVDKKAREVQVLDVEERTVLTDRFVIATGTSITHIRSLVHEIEKQLKEQHQREPDRIEGRESSRWILMDYADVIVHIFHEEERAFYNLEQLWTMSRKSLEA